MELLRKKVEHFVRAHALCEPGDTLIVAFSGGADSVALLDLLSHLPGFKLRLVVAHLNHQLRGAESDGDEQFAREMAMRYACPFAHVRVDVAARAGEQGRSLEETGRETRYAFLREVAGNHAATALAVGHHKGDQAETLLMRLLRGAGGSGLSGMRPKSTDGMVVRPLLSLSRPEIEAYLQTRGLVWREDSSNTDVRFLRNRIRHELLPYLEGCAPDIVERLCQTAAVLAADEDVLESHTSSLFAQAVNVNASGAEVAVEVLRREPPALRKRLYRQALQTVKGDLRRISYAHLAAVDGLVLSARPNSELTLPSGIRAIRTYQSLRFTLQQAEPLPEGQEVHLDRPGLYRLPCGGTLQIERRADSSAADIVAGADLLVVPEGQLRFPLLVRYYRNGDRFVPLGMVHRKKLKDLFVDRKFPQHARKRVPLLVDRGEIVWVCGLQLSEKMRTIANNGGLPWLRLTYTAAAGRY